MMNQIAEHGRDAIRIYPGIIHAQRTEPEATGADAISLAARQIAETLKLSAIVTYTASGTTGLRAARERPQVPIIALSPILDTARRLSLVWGMHCVVIAGRQRPRRHGRPRLPHRARGRFRRAGRPHHHHGRRAAAHARRHQHAAHRLYRRRKKTRPIPSAAASHSAKAPRLGVVGVQMPAPGRSPAIRSSTCLAHRLKVAPAYPPSFSIAATTRSGAIQSGLWPRFLTQTSSAPGMSRARPSEWISS